MIQGIGISKGIGIGRAFILNHKEKSRNRVVMSTVDEINRLEDILKMERSSVVQVLGMVDDKESIDELEFIVGLMKNPNYIRDIKNVIIMNRISCEQGVELTNEMYINRLKSANNGDADIRVSLLEKLTKYARLKKVENLVEEINKIKGNAIIVTDELTIVEVNALDERKILGIVSECKTRTSHATLVAKSLDIPMIVSSENACKKINNGDIIIVDGEEGQVFVAPSTEMVHKYTEKAKKYGSQKKMYEKYINKITQTKDGIRVLVNANVSSIDEVKEAVCRGADGIGLYRTEVEFFRADREIREEEQYHLYTEAIKEAGGRPITFRTLDVGGDKFIEYLNMVEENNPFLGMRGFRFSLAKKNMFLEQISALLRASIYGEIRILIPMISTYKEIKQAQQLIEEVKFKLREKGIAFGQAKVGIMVEVPSIALISDLFGGIVDFLSIGSNDLLQYTVGVDRTNASINHLYDEYNPAILRMIKMIVENSKKCNIPVSLCGDMALNKNLLPLLICLGVRGFSVPPKMIGEIRWTINHIDLKEAKGHEKMYQFACAEEMKKYLVSR